MVEGCRRKHFPSQQQLYQYCYPTMIRICYRYAPDADGAGTIFNNAMLKVFNNMHQYREEGKLMGWIKTLVIHACIDFCKQKNMFKQTVPYVAENDDSWIAPDAVARLSDRDIKQFIAQLPPATATVFNLYMYDGFTHKQIAEQLGISEGTSKWHVSEAKHQLRTILQNITQYEQRIHAAG